MTQRIRQLVAGAGIVIVLTATGQASVAAREIPDEAATISAVARVRTDNPMLLVLLQRATDESATFRSLLSGIEQTDGIIWVEQGSCGPRRLRACLLHRVSIVGSRRLLRVVVSARGSDEETMATLGHELRHALEILADPRVKTDAAMYFFYERNGSRGGDVFETRAAIDAGEAVGRELRALQRAGKRGARD